MSRLWLRNEVFDGVLPLRSTGVPLSPAKGSQLGVGGPSPLFVLLKALREAHPDTVRYTTWITEGWRVLQWSEPVAKLFWEMLCMFHCHTPRLGSTEKFPGVAGKDGGTEKVQAIELPVAQLGLFLFLHLHPDSTNHRLASQRVHNADSVWPSEEATVSLSGSPRRVGGVHSPGRVGRALSPSGPSSPRGFGSSSSGLQMYNSTSPLSPTRTRSMRLHTRTSDDAHRLSFVKRHLHDLLRVVSSHPSALLSAPTASPAKSTSALTPPGDNASGASDSPGLGSVSKNAAAIPAQAAAAAANAADALASGLGPGVGMNEEGGRSVHDGEDEVDLSRSDFEALSFLITGGPSLEKEHESGTSLSDLCTLWKQAGKIRERVPVDEVAEFLMATLTVNEITYPVPPSPATVFLADSATGGGYNAEETSPSTEQPVNSAGVLVPVLPCAPLIVNCATRTTVVHNAEASGPLRDLQLNYCQESYLYVLTPVRFATVLGCKDCTIVVGAAAGMVRVEECERMQLVTCCRRLTVTNSLECIFPVFVASPPVLSGDNRACQFAPYNSCYPRHKSHLDKVGLLKEGEEVPANLWSSPVEASTMGMPSMSAEQRVATGQGVSGAAVSLSRGKSRSPGSKGPGVGGGSELSPAIMPPEQFYTLAVPVAPDSPNDPPAENPFGLPPEYAAVLQEREAAVEGLHRAILEAGLSQRQHRELEECIRGKFTEWLVATGNLRQVLDLVSATEKGNKPSGRGDQTPPRAS